MPKLEDLAKELETMIDRKAELSGLITHVRDDNYNRDLLLKELINHKLRYFAQKLKSGYYELIERLKNESKNKSRGNKKV